MDKENSQECRLCFESKPWDSFPGNRNYKTGKDNRCRVCISRFNKEAKVRRKKAFELGILYNGVICPICLSKCPLDPKDNKSKYAVVDHCHETGNIRGVLCCSCNGALGKLGDNEESISRVLNYLRGTDYETKAPNEETKGTSGPIQSIKRLCRLWI